MADPAVAVRIDHAPSIDGRLDDSVWQQIPPITDFRQREPDEGQPSTERTEVRVAYTSSTLYFGMTLHDSEPHLITRSVLQREGPNQQDDRFVIALDTYHDRHNAYIFGLNPFGTQEDGLITDEGPPNWNWEGVYRSEARITETGWTLEVAIPFSTLRYPDTEEPVMGLLLYRQIRRKNEEVFWPMMNRNYRAGMTQVSRYGTLRGLQRLLRSRNLQVKPYGLVGRQTPGLDNRPSDMARDVGLDVRYAITSDATLDLTYNTDFAQVEADNAQVNLTRFSLFFPEKREFFLERNGLFAFGLSNVSAGSGGVGGGGAGGGGGSAAGQEAVTYFSRRIGLTQPIHGGARLSGRSGGVSYGLLNLQTGDAIDQPGANFAVGRIRADWGRRNNVGAIFTNVQNHAGYNRAVGSDVTLRFFSSSQIAAWVSHVLTPDGHAASTAGDASLLIQNDRASVAAEYLSIGRNFDPAVGFVRRNDMIRHRGQLGWYPRPSVPHVRQVRFLSTMERIQGHRTGDFESGLVSLESRLVFRSLDEVEVEVSREIDHPAQTFTVAGTPIPPGAYAFTFVTAQASTNSGRRLFGTVSAGAGQFYGAHRTRLMGNATVKISPYLRLGGRLERNVFDFPDAGRVSTTLASVDAFVARGRKLYSQWLIQYDSVSQDLQANIRVRLWYRPGSDVFLVLNNMHRFDDTVNPRPRDFDHRAIMAKITYLLAF